jgi:excisionase family DNA binding protein
MQVMHGVTPPPKMVDRRRPLISTGAAATVAGCHPTTILRAIERGELEAVRLGRRGDHRVFVDALDRWMHPVGSEDSA